MNHKMFPKGLFVIAVLLAGTVLSACAGVAAAQDATPTPADPPAAVPATPRTVSVNGSGKAYLVPDIAYINIGVHTQGQAASEAVSSNTEQSQKVAEALNTFGIDAKDIQTSNFSIYPQQQFDNNGQPTGAITYMVDNTVYVTLRDISKIGDLLDAAVRAGANAINGIQFDVADKTAALSEARKAAVADAQAVAQELAEAAGVELGAVQNISVFSGGGPIPVFEGRGGVMMEAASVPVSPGQMILTVEVSLVYEIR